MEMLTEVIEVSHQIIKLLQENGFFEENPFVDIHDLTRDLQWRMQRKWEEENDMFLTDKEFLEVCNKVNENGISETLEGLVQKGALNMSVGQAGDILYSRNPDFDMEDL